MKSRKYEKLAAYWNRQDALQVKFDAAEKFRDAKTMNACQDAYQNLLQEVRAEGETFGEMMRLYSDMKIRGNSRLDLSGTYREPEKIIQVFLAYVEMQTRGSSRYEDSRCHPEKAEK